MPFETVLGGEERQLSVANALASIEDADAVLVHDGARCFVKPQNIADCAEAALKTGAAAVGVKTTDTIKRTKDGKIFETLDRSELINIQTPQAFLFELLKKAHELAEKDGFLGTDECSLVERMDIPITFVEADSSNIKVTTPEDIAVAKKIAGETVRVGTGYDVHRLKRGMHLVLGGETIPHTHGLLGHSDADVLLHAIIDALLGAVASRDIGHHFPCIDEFKNASSLSLLSKTVEIVEEAGYRITGIDSTLIMQRPKVSGYIDNMRVNIAERTGLDVKYVSVKATTTEGLGFEGKRKGISAMATATLIGTE
jgi:2-C-methyl-D-erythritol 4-phosphate cytidylyltransferase/2-C-methyl-D-erythritol 2,4-cyclodiphosphate synthase